jgi:hypothetical protein
MKRLLAVSLGVMLTASVALAQDLCPPSKVNNLAVDGTGHHTAVLSWTDPGDDCATGTAASFEIRRSSAPITEANYYSATVVVSGAAPFGGSCYGVEGLTENTTYYFSITFLDDAGNRSPVSNSPSGTTTGHNTPDITCVRLDPDGRPAGLGGSGLPLA